MKGTNCGKFQRHYYCLVIKNCYNDFEFTIYLQQVADKLIEARYQLLDELFNKFSGPVDLANSIQIVNNIRKIPYLSSTQLRIMVLQYRDVYLEKRLSDIRVSHFFFKFEALWF